MLFFIENCRFVENLALLLPTSNGLTDPFTYIGVNVYGFATNSTAERVFKMSLKDTSNVSAVITILTKTSRTKANYM